MIEPRRDEEKETGRRSPTGPHPVGRAPLPAAWWNLSLAHRRTIASVVALAAIVMAVFGASALLDDGPDEPDPAVFVAALPDERVAFWDDLAACESESRWDLDTGNGYLGGLQFHPESWRAVNGSGSPAEAPREEQIMRAEMLFELQGYDAWPRCSSAIGSD